MADHDNQFTVEPPEHLVSGKMLMTDPLGYMKYLTEMYENNIDDAKVIVNSCEYSGWFGNHAHLLTHLVGNLENYGKYESTDFYGAGIKHFDEELGIRILKLQHLCSVNLSFRDYYERTPIESVRDSGLTKRSGNEEYIKILEILTNK